MSRRTAPEHAGATAAEPTEPGAVEAATTWTAAGFRRANIVGAAATVLSATAVVLAARGYAVQVGSQPGPGLFPTVVGLALLVLGLVWLVGALRHRYLLDEDVEAPPERTALVRAAATCAIVGACAFALRPLGYPLTIALAVGAFTVLGGGKWRAALATGLIFASVSFLLVTTVLGIQLPTGVLRPLLVGLL